MGHPEAPVDFTVQELGDLATFLRGVRWRAGAIPYARLSKLTSWSASALKRATSGRMLPPWDLVRRFLAACRADQISVDHAFTLHERAAKELELRAQRSRKASVVPRPELVRDKADLSGALRDAYAAAGRPPVRTVAGYSGGWVLPHSTAHNIITARALPTGIDQCIAFLDACKIPFHQLHLWFAAWHKAMNEPFAEPRQYAFSRENVYVSVAMYKAWAAARAIEEAAQPFAA
ncbi:helix-turn-helix domain-containing protein [Streptomyces sp. NPDC059355]|uniref:helix-turn-helix domain-containing protein n=1 Tax=Streptomyces sp. NPDC059355 TaxID=3346811 RepID=UPI00367BC1B8